MADIKTNLRELSVIVGLYTNVKKIPYANTPKSFVNICKLALPNVPEFHYKEILAQPTFELAYSKIITNGFNLSNTLIRKFIIKEINEINWFGFDTQKDEPYDISVKNIKFSLKEESFILENMGLYKLLNCYTGSNYSARHIFSDYARNEYEQWFAVTWKELFKVLKKEKGIWSYNNTTKEEQSIIKLTGNKVKLIYYTKGRIEAESILPKECTLPVFEADTTSRIREKVFAKFINMTLSENKNYNVFKKKCAVVAANTLVLELNKNLNYCAGLPRFLRIHDYEYYYAKTTNKGVEIYKVPALSSFGHSIIIESITASVPNNQANILTTIRNKKTGKKLILRNECRFSHGQFNGTPEAKMYYENHGSLETIYEPV